MMTNQDILPHADYNFCNDPAYSHFYIIGTPWQNIYFIR